MEKRSKWERNLIRRGGIIALGSVVLVGGVLGIGHMLNSSNKPDNKTKTEYVLPPEAFGGPTEIKAIVSKEYEWANFGEKGTTSYIIEGHGDERHGGYSFHCPLGGDRVKELPSLDRVINPGDELIVGISKSENRNGATHLISPEDILSINGVSLEDALKRSKRPANYQPAQRVSLENGQLKKIK